MKRTPTNEELKEKIAKLEEENESIDMDRGYCKLQFPSVSDVWAEECYQRHWKVIKPLLVDYASLVLANDEFVPIGKDNQVKEWIRELEVASEANDTALGCKCAFLAYIYLPPLINGESKRLSPEKYADLASRTASDYPYSVYHKERYEGDYDGNYDEYYKQKREELDRWQNEQ